MLRKPLLIVLTVLAGLALFFGIYWVWDSLDSTYRVSDLERNGRVFAVLLLSGIGSFLIYKRIQAQRERRNDRNGY